MQGGQPEGGELSPASAQQDLRVLRHAADWVVWVGELWLWWVVGVWEQVGWVVGVWERVGQERVRVQSECPVEGESAERLPQPQPHRIVQGPPAFGSLLFWRTLRAKGQKLDLGEEEVMQEIEKDFFFLAHQVATESFNYLPDATVLQPFPDLRVVVGRSATNLLGGDRSIAAHVDMLMLMVVGSRVV